MNRGMNASMNRGTNASLEHTRVTSLVLIGLAVLSIAACDSQEVTQCRSSYLTAHALVSSADTGELESVQQALSAVNRSLAVCESAGQREEIKQLKEVQTKLQTEEAHLARQATQKRLTPDELQALKKSGDPACPKGETYQHAKSNVKVRCTGPRLVHMNWRQADTYFTSRGYKVTKEDGRLRAEYGSESYTYSFLQADDESPAKCLTLFAAPGIPWQEAVSKVTGVRPNRLKLGTPVKTAKGELALGVIPDQQQAIIKLGECEK